MASVEQPLGPSPFLATSTGYNPHTTKSIPILPSSSTTTTSSSAASSTSTGDPMDTTQPNTTMGPPMMSSPNGDRPADQHLQMDALQPTTNGASSQAVGAAAAAQQPKVVQTAFIHKLYNMLEDQTISHLISWAQSGESFVMSPSSEFSKVLAQYFKHTNISSFVRQLNMYGFHKVSDVFHTGSPESTLWEFKHGAGNFKRGDLNGLREIKRRASRHTLIHRDSFSNPPKMPVIPPPPGTALEQPMQDPIEARFGMVEWQMQETYSRLARTEEAYGAMTAKCQTLLEGLTRCHQWNNDLSTHLLTLVPDPDNPVHREVYAMRQDIQRHLEHLRTAEDSPDPLFPNKQSFYQNANLGPPDMGPPMSPRQRPLDDSRRPSLQALGRPSSFRTAVVPPHLQQSPRRYGSIGAASGAYSPSSSRPTYLPPPPPPAPAPHPLATSTSSPPANLARRHTSADIRVHGWSGGSQQQSSFTHASSPYASGTSSTAWPSSPRQPPQFQAPQVSDQHLRDTLAAYELPSATSSSTRRHGSPPPMGLDAGWQLPGRAYAFKGTEVGSGTPGPGTRRSSMASNVHSLRNPADTAERGEEEEEGGGVGEERKRRRMG